MRLWVHLVACQTTEAFLLGVETVAPLLYPHLCVRAGVQPTETDIGTDIGTDIETGIETGIRLMRKEFASIYFMQQDLAQYIVLRRYRA